ncbi:MULTISPECIES: Rne/Rng family ribonuclease [unclassified Cryobacterium]|uniref:Rne/Rng family ribonuclease n=1 Tax=unclassified Cryobacterium TaxID=2649013 RepID=UPI002AB3A514|nr:MULTISPECIES: Rne/Rng family ribonuclease [unclassified Cryobacterium]MDY7544140.1 Rne/Rng family ribonuclease [Cryobacterium sp. 5B3]MEB0000184.1 Rne/Rng family ribonuclease [Cryobacterium sp. RTS3]MEB0267975.1 Rne/Rng family ribonuclease [Cryobacterium sp. 10I5]MEB0276375.1 Rne/Rng family ribonuclease [Cryobacterium sp. 5B3]
MVEDNENTKKRKGLFGSRRRRVAAAAIAPAEAPAPAPSAATETVEPPTAPFLEGEPAPWANTETTPAEQDTIVDQPTPPVEPAQPVRRPSTSLLFQAPNIVPLPARSGGRRDDSRAFDDRQDGNRSDGDRQDNRSGNRQDGNRSDSNRQDNGADNRHDRNRSDNRPDGRSDRDEYPDETSTVRRRARRRPGDENRSGADDPANTVVRVRVPREPELITEPQRIKGSTRLEAKKQRRRDGRDAGRRRPVITEAEFLARRESVDRVMVVRAKHNKIQIGVLEDGVLVEHYVAKNQDASLIGNVYLGRVQNVLPSMEAAFVDIGRGRNAVLYSGEVDWEAAAEHAANSNQARRIELALKPGDKVLVQVTKDPIGHKGARLTSQVSLPGRYLVYVPNGSMNGISRKLPDTERARLKKILKEVLPDNTGVIVRTAAEGATDEQLTLDVNRLTEQWASISKLVDTVQAPALLHGEPDLLIKIVRDVFNEDFQKMVISGDEARETIQTYLGQVAPDLVDRVERYEGENDAFDEYRISEQIEKALDRKVWLPSGGSLVIDRTEAMTVVDVNTGKFVGSGGNLEETVTKNNLEAAEEIVRQLRLRDIGGIIVVDFIDMVLETNRDLVLRRLLECLSRDRTKHQVAEVTSLGLVQMTRKKLGLGLLESFSENCEACAGRGVVIHHDPVTKHRQTAQPPQERRPRSKAGNSGNGNDNNGGNGSNGNGGNNGHRGGNSGNNGSQAPSTEQAKATSGTHGITEDAKHALALIAARTIPRALTGSIPIIHVPDAPVSTPVSAEPEAHEATTEAAPAPVAEASVAPVETADIAHAVAEAVAQGFNPDPIEANTGSVEILDIPVRKSSRTRRTVSKQVTDQLLDSVLESLPEPKQPGQGRSRSRRVTTAGGSTSNAQPIVLPARETQN